MSLYDASGPLMEWDDEDSAHHSNEQQQPSTTSEDDDDDGMLDGLEENNKKKPTTTNLGFLADNTGSTDHDSSDEEEDADGNADMLMLGDDDDGGEATTEVDQQKDEDLIDEESMDDVALLERLHVKAKVLLAVVDLYGAGYILPNDRAINASSAKAMAVEVDEMNGGDRKNMVDDMTWNLPFSYDEPEKQRNDVTTTAATGARHVDPAVTVNLSASFPSRVLPLTTPAHKLTPSRVRNLAKLREKIAREVVTSGSHLKKARDDEEATASSFSASPHPTSPNHPMFPLQRRGKQQYVKCNLVGYLEAFVATLLQEDGVHAVCYPIRDRRPQHRLPMPGNHHDASHYVNAMIPPKALEVDLVTCHGSRYIKVKAFSEKNARQDVLGQTTDRKDFSSAIKSLTTICDDAIDLPFGRHPEVVIATLHEMPRDVKDGFMAESGCKAIESVKEYSKLFNRAVTELITAQDKMRLAAKSNNEEDTNNVVDTDDDDLLLSGGMEADASEALSKQDQPPTAAATTTIFDPLSELQLKALHKQNFSTAVENASSSSSPAVVGSTPTPGKNIAKILDKVPLYDRSVLAAALAFAATVAPSSTLHKVFHEDTIPIRYVNFDVTALVALVSDTCNGHAGTSLPKQRVLNEQSAQEVHFPAVQDYLLPTLKRFTRVLSVDDAAEVERLPHGDKVGEAIKQRLISEELQGFDPFPTHHEKEEKERQLLLNDVCIPAVKDISPLAVDVTEINTAAHTKQIHDDTQGKDALLPFEELLHTLRKEKLRQAGGTKKTPCLAVNWVVSDIALSEFGWIVDTIAGDAEKDRAARLLPNLIVVPAGKFFNTTRAALAKPKPSLTDMHEHFSGVSSPLERLNELYKSKSGVLRLVDSGKIGFRHKAVFGIGELLSAVTLSANHQFAQAAKDQGVHPCVRFHPSRALTERKRLGIDRGAGPKRPPEIYPTLEKELLAQAMHSAAVAAETAQ